LAFKVLLENLAGRSRARILDLGPAVGQNVSFFSSYTCRLHICDLYSSIQEFKATRAVDLEASDLDGLEEYIEGQLPKSENDPFDLILTWDIFNYMRREELAILGSQLARRCKPEGHIYALVSTKNRIPNLPTTFEIQSSEILRYSPTTRAERPCPQYKQPDLARALPDLDVETSFLLRHGVQEYVLCHVPRPSTLTSSSSPPSSKVDRVGFKE
jgi:SAM-dependent methyltransferase